MKKKIKTILTWIVIIIAIISLYAIWQYYGHMNNIYYLTECCKDNYNGNFYWNNCDDNSANCLMSTIGWRCRFNNNDTGITEIPARLLNCST